MGAYSSRKLSRLDWSRSKRGGIFPSTSIILEDRFEWWVLNSKLREWSTTTYLVDEATNGPDKSSSDGVMGKSWWLRIVREIIYASSGGSV